MLPDKAAELLQFPERGLDLLKRMEEDERVFKALQRVELGFSPAEVCELYGFPYEAPVEEAPTPDSSGVSINVWECKTNRCRQKGRVSTATQQPRCPSCNHPMEFLISVEDVADIGHMRRTYIPDPGLTDPLARTDKTNAPEFGGRWDD